MPSETETKSSSSSEEGEVKTDSSTSSSSSSDNDDIDIDGTSGGEEEEEEEEEEQEQEQEQEEKQKVEPKDSRRSTSSSSTVPSAGSLSKGKVAEKSNAKTGHMTVATTTTKDTQKDSSVAMDKSSSKPHPTSPPKVVEGDDSKHTKKKEENGEDDDDDTISEQGNDDEDEGEDDTDDDQSDRPAPSSSTSLTNKKKKKDKDSSTKTKRPSESKDHMDRPSPSSNDHIPDEVYERARASIIAQLTGGKSDLRIPSSSIASAAVTAAAGTGPGAAYSLSSERLATGSTISMLQAGRAQNVATTLTTPLSADSGFRGGASADKGGLVLGPPRVLDVIIGQEAIIYGQDGNVQLQNLVRTNIGEETSTTEINTLKASAIFSRMVSLGARFLIKEPESRSFWYQLSEPEAVDLIIQCICEEEKKVRLLRTLREREQIRRGSLLSAGSSAGGGMSFLKRPPGFPSALPSMLGAGIPQPSPTGQNGLSASNQSSFKINSYDAASPKSKNKRSVKDIGESGNLSDAAAHSPARLLKKKKKKKSKDNRKDTSLKREAVDHGQRRSEYSTTVHRYLAEEAKERPSDGLKTTKSSRVGSTPNSKDDSIKSEKATTSAPSHSKPVTTSLSSYQLIARANDEAATILRGPVKIGKYDVVLGRGRGNFQNPGNRNLIQSFRASKQAYNEASKKGKSQIARDIVKNIRDKGGRFIKKIDNDTWKMIGDDEAFRKVSHGIRDLRDSERRLELFQNDSELSDSDEDGRVTFPTNNTNPTAAGNGSNGMNCSVISPHDKDIVCGRGKALNRHPGNRRMTRIVRKYKDQYRLSTSQDDKAHIANRVLDIVKSNGARFLKCDEAGKWQELPYKVALKKVYHSIRDIINENVDDYKNAKHDDEKSSDDGDEEIQVLASARRSSSIEMLQSQGMKKRAMGMHSTGTDGIAGRDQDSFAIAAATAAAQNQQQQLALHHLNAEREARMRLGLVGGGQGSMLSFPKQFSGRYDGTAGAAAASMMNNGNVVPGLGASFSMGSTGHPMMMMMMQQQQQQNQVLQQQQHQLHQQNQVMQQQQQQQQQQLHQQSTMSQLQQEHLRALMMNRDRQRK